MGILVTRKRAYQQIELYYVQFVLFDVFIYLAYVIQCLRIWEG